MTKRFNYHYDGFCAYYLCDKAKGTYEDSIIGEIWADKSDMTDLVDLLNKLSDENEQLKTTIQQLTNDNTKQKKKLNTTMKENEQLKCGNKNLKATLNDFINILNRLQSNPTDKQTLAVARDMLQNMGKELEE